MNRMAALNVRPLNPGRMLPTLVTLVISILLSYAIIIPGSLAAEKKSAFTITIIHTNDIHSHDEPYFYNGKLVGGMDRVGHKIRSLKEECLKAKLNYLVVDAGDVFQGSTLYSHYKGDVEVNLLNKVGYDIFTLGNHEFDDGASNVAKQFKNAKFDIINSNLDFKPVKALDEMVKPYVIKEFDGQKIAFVGAITPQMELLSGGLEGCKLKAKGDNWMKPIKEQVDKLTAMGINKIILVTHIGVDDECDLAKALPEVDAIIGGHSHTELKKRIIINHENATTTVVQTGCYGHNVGRLELAFDKDGVVDTKKSKYKLYPITEKIQSDKDIKNYVALKVKPLLYLRKEIVGFVARDFGTKIRRTDSPIGNLICDALADFGADYGVEITMHNRGGIRGQLNKGPLSAEGLEQILPFDNYAVFAEVKGKTILEALEHSVGGSIGGKFVDIHGLKVAYDVSKPRGQRIIFVLFKDKEKGWVPLDAARWYKFGMNSYNFGGGEGFNFKSARNIKSTKARMADVLKKYLAKHEKVSPQKPNRLVAIKSGILTKDKTNKLKLKGVAPGAQLSLVAGSEPGVSTIYKAFPVPLNNANIIQKKLTANENGEFIWSSAKQLAGQARAKLKIEKDKKDKLWMCVVAFPKTKSRKHRTMISNPIAVNSTQ